MLTCDTDSRGVACDRLVVFVALGEEAAGDEDREARVALPFGV